MRIDRVVARAFGPFHGEELKLAPGMTVVAGPNEAGKSSWHAALRLALTGLRRGKGPGTAIERQLAERHRPWDEPDRWEVEARLELADGRTIEIRQDLLGKVDCRAIDTVLGRDVSDEILDGTPDASRWLGLTRDAFAATVSVSQAQIMAVTDAADELQEQMQRAAATRGTDGTAAEAIDRLEQFRRDAVGVDRVGARGPLRTTKDRLVALEARQAEIRRQHEEYLERSAAIESADEQVAQARRRVLGIETELAIARSIETRSRFEQAAALAARHPQPPQALTTRDALADEVAAALDAWTSRPEPVELSGPSAEELQAEVDALPGVPEGDLEVHPSVHEARRGLDMAEAALAALVDQPAESGAGLPPVSEDRVRELARRLRMPQLPGAAGLEAELAAARQAAAGAASSLQWPAAGAGGLAAIGGLALLAVGLPLPGALLLVVAAMVAGLAWRSGSGARQAVGRAARAEAALAPYRAAREAAEHDRVAAVAEAERLGLPTGSTALDELADRLGDAAASRRMADERGARIASLEARRDTASAALSSVLAERGAGGGAEPRAALHGYEVACRERAAQAAAGARREPLSRQIEARRSAERSAAAALAAALAAEQRLTAAAKLAGLPDESSPDPVAESLRSWQRQRAARLQQNEAAIGEWQRLQALLDGRSLADLEALATEAERTATELTHELGERPRSVASLGLPELEARLGVARRALMAASSEADALRGNLAARRESLPDVAEAEEATASARAELDRIHALAATLDTALGLLRSAEERVHRSLAPILATSIGRWLPAVSAGAYQEVSVDPADLSVRVKESSTGKWRAARLLSEGTREQIYLLLRVAMAEHLVVNGEVAPLLLDEVTVQSDMERKRQLLAVLHALSAERQVVIFSHDDDVLSWADVHLDTARDAVVRLVRATSAPRPISVGVDSHSVAANLAH